MNIVLWILQALLAFAFGMAGSMKVAQPREKLLAQGERMAWTKDIPLPLLKFIGISEVAGALGLILPALTGIAVDLTPLAAIGLATIMVLASILHFTRKEYNAIAINAVLFAIAAFIAYGRLELATL